MNFDRAAGYYDATRALPAAAVTELAGELAGRQPCLEIGVGTERIALPPHVAEIAMAAAELCPLVTS